MEHLHPILQRRLIDYLRDETDNQYFVATHSATFIDTADAAVFQVTNDGVQTYIKPALIKLDKRKICMNLGLKASDILQTNAIVWVEGPSDRLYLNHWINAVDSRLLEGLHYTVMFYGGRLLSHLSADDYQVAGFIDLLPINKNAAILIDSDRAKSGDRINETKRRIRKEFEDAGGFCWVTQGREIENYIDAKVLQEEVRKCHPRVYDKPNKTGPYSHALEFVRNRVKGSSQSMIEKEVDKVGVANGVVGVEGGRPNLETLDLKKQVTALARFLAVANGLPVKD